MKPTLVRPTTKEKITQYVIHGYLFEIKDQCECVHK